MKREKKNKTGEGIVTATGSLVGRQDRCGVFEYVHHVLGITVVWYTSNK